MSRFWSDVVRGLTPYVPGEQPQHERLVKLNTNECALPPSPAVMAAIAAVDGDDLRRYPDPQALALRTALARRYDLEVDQVFVGNGSDEVLAHVYHALLQHDKPLLFPDISYSFYPVWCQLYGVDYRQVPVTDDYRINVADYAGNNGGIIIPNPNAPTGILLTLEDIQQLLRDNPDSVVVIDEAYIDFGGASAISLIDEYDNLLVVHTVSKSRALAGLRVGMAYGHADLIEGLTRVKDSFNSYPLDVLAQRATLASIEDEAYFRDSCEQVVTERQYLTEGLEALGFSVLPSSANFVLASPPRGEAGALFTVLREQGIIVRYFDKPRLREQLRISVGGRASTEALLSAASDWLTAL
jgi:histidinol-phosphate aminotransferase